MRLSIDFSNGSFLALQPESEGNILTVAVDELGSDIFPLQIYDIRCSDDPMIGNKLMTCLSESVFRPIHQLALGSAAANLIVILYLCVSFSQFLSDMHSGDLGPLTSVAFSPAEPYLSAVTAENFETQLYDIRKIYNVQKKN